MHGSRRRLSGGLAAAAIVGAALACPAAAEAQQSGQVDLPKFDPAPAGDRFFGVPSPFAPGKLTFHGGIVLDYAHDPLVLEDSNGKVLGKIIEHQLFLHLNVAFSIINRIEINADMPFALVNAGDGKVAGGTFSGTNAFQSPDQAGVGDLRLGARFRFFGEYYDPFQISLGGYVWLPTATDGDFIGSGIRGEPQVLVGGRADRFIYSVMLGPEFRQPRSVGGVKISHQFDWGAGVGLLLGTQRQFQVGIETTGGVTLEDTSTRSTNAEALVGAKYRIINPIEIGAGVGPGFASGVGTPDVRAVFNLFYTPEPPKPILDRDHDGIPDDKDACPDEPGPKSDDPKKNGCPIRDRDHDGIPDDEDACPDHPAPKSADPKKNGRPLPKDTDGDGIPDDKDACPTEPGPPNDDPKKNGCPIRDRDHDGIPDDEDACPDRPGVKTDDPKTNGCPPDSDGDGIPDDLDACPHEKGPPDPDPKKNGCPKLVRVTEKEIVILEQVQFDIDRSNIKPVSDALLDAVAEVMNEHPEILKIEVQGHTDNQGPKAHNQTLSQSRADSVLKALQKRKVDPSRMVAKGYGQEKPIDTNDTPDGRQKNRRVQFVVLEKTSKAPEVQQAPPPGPMPPTAPPPPAKPPVAPKPPPPKP